MKKTTILGFALVSMIFLSGCAQKKEIIDDQKSVSGDVKSEIVSDNEVKQEKVEEGGALNSLKSAILSGKKMRCTYKIKEGNVELKITTYVQGDKYKTEVDLGQVKTNSIFDGDVVYSWSVGQKTGTKMTMDCMKSLGEDLPKNNEADKSVPEDSEEFVDSLKDSQDLSCENFDEVDFEVPTDIEFVDQCEMLKAQQKLMEGFGN